MGRHLIGLYLVKNYGQVLVFHRDGNQPWFSGLSTKVVWQWRVTWHWWQLFWQNRDHCMSSLLCQDNWDCIGGDTSLHLWGIQIYCGLIVQSKWRRSELADHCPIWPTSNPVRSLWVMTLKRHTCSSPSHWCWFDVRRKYVLWAFPLMTRAWSSAGFISGKVFCNDATDSEDWGSIQRVLINTGRIMHSKKQAEIQ